MKFILFAIVIMFGTPSYAEECKGHIFFYNLEKNDAETDSDFSYFYNQIAPILKERGVSTSLHTDLPIKSKTCFAGDVEVPKNKLEMSLGYMLMKPNRDIKVFGGVMTDVDLNDAAREFFNLK